MSERKIFSLDELKKGLSGGEVPSESGEGAPDRLVEVVEIKYENFSEWQVEIEAISPKQEGSGEAFFDKLYDIPWIQFPEESLVYIKGLLEKYKHEDESPFQHSRTGYLQLEVGGEGFGNLLLDILV